MEGLVQGTKSAPASPNTGVLDLTWDEETARSLKRMKGEDGRPHEELRQVGKEALATLIRKVIREIGKEVRVVSDAAKERNTKKEVKEAASKMGNLMNQLMTVAWLGRDMGPVHTERMESFMAKEKENLARFDKLEQQICALNKEVENLKKENMMLKAGKMETDEAASVVGARTSAVDEGPQTEEDQNKARETRNITREQIEEAKDFSGFQGISGKTWHPGIYKNAFIAVGSPLMADKEADLVILEEEDAPKAAGNKALYKAFMQRYPTLKDMEGKLTTMVINTTIEDRAGKKITSEKHIHRAEIENSRQDWYETLKTLKERTLGRTNRKLVVYPSAYDKEGKDTRKMVECIFWDTGIKCLIYPGKVEEKGTRRGKENRKLFGKSILVTG